MKPTCHPLAGHSGVLATKHKKTSLIAPAMREIIGMNVRCVEVDTDQLGTFGGQIARTGTPLQTAIAKAKLGIKESGERLGFASEGSISADSLMPLVADYEIVVFVNSIEGYEVSESVRSFDIIVRSTSAQQIEELETFLTSADFPHHGLIVRPADNSYDVIYKGIHDYDTLKSALKHVSRISQDSRAIVETDLRAHHCPSRQRNIEAAAVKLAERLKELCPACRTPGWGVVRVNHGLPCDWCGMKTSLICEKVFGCAVCDREDVRNSDNGETADPQWCERCNP